MPEIVLAVTIFWGLLLIVLGIIAITTIVGTDGSDSLLYAAIGVAISGAFLALNGAIITILDAIFKSSMGVG